jgi:hypothetical protein
MPWGQKAKGKRKKAKGGREKRKEKGKRQKEKGRRKKHGELKRTFAFFRLPSHFPKGRLSDEWVPKQKSQGGTWFPRCAPWDESVIAENDRPLKAPRY